MAVPVYHNAVKAVMKHLGSERIPKRGLPIPATLYRPNTAAHGKPARITLFDPGKGNRMRLENYSVELAQGGRTSRGQMQGIIAKSTGRTLRVLLSDPLEGITEFTVVGKPRRPA